MAILNPMSTRFFGGISLPGDKKTGKSAIEVMPSPKKVYLHLSQHTGNPTQPLVKKGDIVKIGTKIGESDGFISVPIHASIAGKVVSVAQHPHPILGSSLCYIIESTGNDEWEPSIKEDPHYENLAPEDLLVRIKDAGIVGLGGGAFPTHVKLSPPDEKPIDTLIINGCECEPMLSTDHRLMLEYSTGIIEGAKIFQKILNTEKLIFAIEDNKKDAAEILRTDGVMVRLLRTKYPQGAERQLIKTLLGREVPKGSLPMDIGCVVQNVATCYAAFQATKFHKPLVDRVITVTGDGVKESKNILIRIGTPAIDAINYCGGYTGEPKMIIFGGPMTGTAQYSENVPVIKATTGIIIWSKAKTEHEGPCVRCGQCVDVCPMGLMPTEIYNCVKHNIFEKTEVLGILDCIECGCCAYACPAKIPLVHYLKYGKHEVRRR